MNESDHVVLWYWGQVYTYFYLFCIRKPQDREEKWIHLWYAVSTLGSVNKSHIISQLLYVGSENKKPCNFQKQQSLFDLSWEMKRAIYLQSGVLRSFEQNNIKEVPIQYGEKRKPSVSMGRDHLGYINLHTVDLY